MRRAGSHALESLLDRLVEEEERNQLTAIMTASNAPEFCKTILKLQREIDHLCDTVWLATSPAQMKELWSRVGKLVGEEDTELQREALEIAPFEI
ncbi:MAG: hypothetical protein ACREDR_02560 [Blastocatellia bacterium]